MDGVLIIEALGPALLIPVASPGPVLIVSQSASELLIAGTPGPAQSGAAGAVYVHNQSAPAATWTINHNLGFRPSIELWDSGGAEFNADILHISANQAQVFLNVALAGTARCT